MLISAANEQPWCYPSHVKNLSLGQRYLGQIEHIIHNLNLLHHVYN